MTTTFKCYLGAYSDIVSYTQSANLLGYWPLRQSSGTVTVDDLSGNDYDGIATGVNWSVEGISDGHNAGAFNGTNSTVDVSSTAAAFDGAKGTISAWIRIATPALTDGTVRAIADWRVDASNRVLVYKAAANNTVALQHTAGGTTVSATATISDNLWHHVCVTWFQGGNAKIYIDGALIDTQPGVGTWSGSIASADIGSQAGSVYFWSGYIAHVALWNKVLTDTEVEALYSIGLDISSYVKSVFISAGIKRETARIADIGRCTLVLNNVDKSFSPNNAGSDYFNYLKPNQLVRIDATQGASTWTLFRGHARLLRPQAGVGGTRETTIICEDALSALSRAALSITLQENKTADELLTLICNRAYSARYASGTITISGAPSAGDTVSVAGQTYTFRSSVSTTANEVLIGATATATGTNLAAAINGAQIINNATAPGTLYGSNTSKNAYCSASNASGVVTVRAFEPGTYANSLALAESAINVAVSGSTLVDGANEPNGLTDFETGIQTTSVAGDLWEEGTTRAVNALADCVYSEYGLFWVARDGTLTFKNHQYEFDLPQAAAALTLTGQHDEQGGGMSEDRIKNRVIVSYTPRTESTSAQVVAKANNTIIVPGTSGTERFNRAQGYVGSSSDDSTIDAPSAGDKILRLPFRDTSGNAIGAKDLIAPVPSTDYTVNDFADEGGFDYTNTGRISVSLVHTGGGVEASFVNDATGPLYIFDFQVRGTALYSFDPVQEIREDSTSVADYGVREYPYSLPLESDSVFPESLSTYLLSRYKSSEYIVNAIGFNKTVANGTNVLSLEYGDTITLTEDQTGVSSKKYLITGADYSIEAGFNIQSAASYVKTILHVRPIDDVTYWILGDTTYGVLGSTTRPAL